MATSNNLVTFEDAVARIGTLPTLEPSPNAKNIRALSKALTDALHVIPLYQSQRFGYMGMVTVPEEYSLLGEQLWADFPDPSYHQQLGGMAAEQRDQETEQNTATNIYPSQENVRQAINKALTAAIPATFRRAGDNIEPNVYTATDDPGMIMVSLNNRYGTPKPGEKTEADTDWRKAWNPSKPIGTMVSNLEELFVRAVISGVPYTQRELLDRTLDNIKQTSLYMMTVMDWNKYDKPEKIWANFNRITAN